MPSRARRFCLVGLEKFGKREKQNTHLILFEMFVVFLYICTERERENVNKEEEKKVVTKFLQTQNGAA